MKADPPPEDVSHHADHVIDIERADDSGIEHVPPGGEGHFLVLEVEDRLGKLIEIADVVVMEVGDDHVLDGGRVDTDGGQAFRRATDMVAAPGFCRFGIEAGIDNEGAGLRDRRPDEIIDGHGIVGVRRVDEIKRLGAVVGGVADREQLVDFGIGVGHDYNRYP